MTVCMTCWGEKISVIWCFLIIRMLEYFEKVYNVEGHIIYNQQHKNFPVYNCNSPFIAWILLVFKQNYEIMLIIPLYYR